MKFLSTVIVLLFAAVAGAQNIERINPEGMTQPAAYRHLVKVDKLLFIAGQVALDGDGNVIGKGDMPAQVRQVLENLKPYLPPRAQTSPTSSRSIFSPPISIDSLRPRRCAASISGIIRPQVRWCRSNVWRARCSSSKSRQLPSPLSNASDFRETRLRRLTSAHSGITETAIHRATIHDAGQSAP